MRYDTREGHEPLTGNECWRSWGCKGVLVSGFHSFSGQDGSRGNPQGECKDEGKSVTNKGEKKKKEIY